MSIPCLRSHSPQQAPIQAFRDTGTDGQRTGMWYVEKEEEVRTGRSKEPETQRWCSSRGSCASGQHT